ncbi:MAG TPA: AMP-binding protein, partial [Blastocatellia bacterium]|nr:AMP-binding protein [Blastocatellia bacterium]
MTTEMRVVADIPRAHAALRPDKIATVFEDRETTFAELDRRASRVANGLVAEGVKPQTRIAVLDKNSDHFFEILFGSAKANDVIVAVNWRLAPPEIAYIINDAMAEILFVGADYLDTAEKIRGDLQTVKKIIALSGAHPEWESYAAWRDRQSDVDPLLPVKGADVTLQMYTSGTTGHPKGAQITNDNLLALMPAFMREWSQWTDADVNMVCMPLFHIGGTGAGLLGLYAGAKTVILRD